MINIGDKIPNFELEDDESIKRRIYEFIGTEFMVIYFYPMDFTPGCSKEACSFRDNYEFFSEQKINIVGISSDSPTRHKKFRNKYNLPFTLLSDRGNKVRKLFGLKGYLFGLIPDRTTYIVDHKGVVLHIFDRLLQYENHVKEAIAIIEEKLSKRR